MQARDLKLMAVAVGAACIQFLGIPGPASAQETTIVGKARIIDGDTLDIGRQRVRIHGIDAPETHQTCDQAGQVVPCGHEAAEALERKVGRSQVTCTGTERDQYDRLIAVCEVAGVDVGSWLVEQGRAVAFVRFSSDYIEAEKRARARKIGIWATTFVMPWDYRQAQWEANQKVAQGTPSTGTKGCLIKGNISAKGEKIYHLPGQAFYAKTDIEPQKGERWFCTEAEAKTAGWRPSQR